MTENCLDIGIIQSFLDGELAHAVTARVSGHLALCDKCAVMLAEAEDQSSVVFSVLENEFNTLVPTQRLWSRINDSIITESRSRPFWERAYAFLAVALANPSLAAAASLLIVFGIVATIWLNQAPVSSDVAVNRIQPQQAVPASNPPLRQVSDPMPETAAVDTPDESSFRVERAAYRLEPRRVAPETRVIGASAMTSNGYLPGEESYVKTISSLARTVEEQTAGGIMRPSERIAYERDMAVVDDAIAKMKKEVKRNPRNDSAKQVLYSSYQHKIDLLTSVSQKEELLVSLK